MRHTDALGPELRPTSLAAALCARGEYTGGAAPCVARVLACARTPRCTGGIGRSAGNGHPRLQYARTTRLRVCGLWRGVRVIPDRLDRAECGVHLPTRSRDRYFRA